VSARQEYPRLSHLPHGKYEQLVTAKQPGAAAATAAKYYTVTYALPVTVQISVTTRFTRNARSTSQILPKL